MTQSILDEMKQLGFTEYEVKAYLALLKQHPVNGYALSKESGIPRSRIYDVLKSLQEKQAVFESRLEKTAVYSPQEPVQMMNRLRERYQAIFNRVEEHARQLYTDTTEENSLITLTGQEAILDFLRQVIPKAQHRIDLAIWTDELEAVRPELETAAQKGISIKGVYFGKGPVFQLVSHRRLDRYLAEKHHRSLMAILDRRHVMYGIVSRGADSQVTWTEDLGFVDMALDYIAHDLIVNRYSAGLEPDERQLFEDFADQVWDEYGQD